MNRHDTGEVTFFTFDLLEGIPGMVHAVSTRSGGVSRAPFDSLNLAFHVGDDPEAVLENRERFAAAVGFTCDEVVTTRQVHGTTVRLVRQSDRGTGAVEPTDASWACDALVTDEACVFLMGFSADCPLVMLTDAEAGVVALAHAGWRGAFAGILPETISVMKTVGAESSRMLAALSPAIGGCCYEVGAELIDALGDERETYRRFFRPHGDKFLLDLPGLCRRMLISSGLSQGNIEIAETCTRCNEETFFSYRAADGATGRCAAVIGRRPQT